MALQDVFRPDAFLWLPTMNINQLFHFDFMRELMQCYGILRQAETWNVTLHLRNNGERIAL